MSVGRELPCAPTTAAVKPDAGCHCYVGRYVKDAVPYGYSGVGRGLLYAPMECSGLT